MDQKLIERLVKNTLSTIAFSVADDLCEIVKNHVDDEETVKAIHTEMVQLLETVMKKKAPSKAGTSNKSTTLKDSSGEAILCSAIKKNGEQCTNKAKTEIDGAHYCGVHSRGGSGNRPDPNKRPTVNTTSSFENVVYGVDMGVDVPKFEGIDDIPDI